MGWDQCRTRTLKTHQVILSTSITQAARNIKMSNYKLLILSTLEQNKLGIFEHHIDDIAKL